MAKVIFCIILILIMVALNVVGVIQLAKDWRNIFRNDDRDDI